MNLKIYKPKIEQIDEIIPLWEGQYIYHNNLDPEYYVKCTNELKSKFRSYLETSIEKDNPMILVAELEHEIVGFITYDIEENDYLDSKITRYGVMIELFVHVNFRKQGIGTKLMETVEEYFKQQNLKFVKIELSTFNSGAMKLYSDMGYVNRQSFVYKEI